ncbi:MAG: Smr/MutS family protein [Myxococcota bacterium]
MNDGRARFVFEDDGAAFQGRRDDVGRRTLADLRAGRVAVDREVDLHGLLARDARRELLAELADALRAGDRCVLVIHGAGHHSREGPVLRRKLPGWLMEGPRAGDVLAFASAPRKLGGAGASLVLLRRVRS